MYQTGFSNNRDVGFFLLHYVKIFRYSHKKNLCLTTQQVMAAVMKEMEQYKKCGGGSIVENTSCGIRRNVKFMRDISLKHGINIVAGAGRFTTFMIIVCSSKPEPGKQHNPR